MSDIVINNKNLSRFSKRLKKSILSNHGVEISLNESYQLIANMLGSDSLYNLQKKLELELQVQSKDDADSLIELIQNYFNNNEDSLITDFCFTSVESYQSSINSISVGMYSAQYKNDKVGFNLSFGMNRDFLNHQLDRKEYIVKLDREEYIVNLLDKDKEFLRKVSELMLEDKVKSLNLGNQLKERLKLTSNGNCSMHYFKEESDYVHLTNIGPCKKNYVLVNKDYFERIGAPFVHFTDEIHYIDLTKEQELMVFGNLTDALQKMNKEHLLLEYLTLKTATNNKKLKGYSTYYLYYDNNTLKLSTVSGKNYILSEIKNAKYKNKEIKNRYTNLQYELHNVEKSYNEFLISNHK